MRKRELLRRLREKVKPYGLDAFILGNAKTVGVQGDERTYTHAACLTGKFPGYMILEKLSSEISNELPFNRVTYETAVKKPRPRQK